MEALVAIAAIAAWAFFAWVLAYGRLGQFHRRGRTK